MADNKKDLEYSAILQDFAKSIGQLADSIKKQAQSKDANNKDNKETNKEQVQYLIDMSEKLDVIVTNTTSTKDNTDHILQIVKGIKQEKKKGIWEKLSPKDKTKSMADGIKTIALMAGSILAIGAAFKLVGEVDFASVIALATALPLMALAFDLAGKQVHSIKESLLIAGSIVIMSAALVAAGFILKAMPEVGMQQILSAAGVGIAMGLALLPLTYAASLVNGNIKDLLILAVAMPLISLGMLASAEILQNMPIIPAASILGVVELALGIGVATLAVGGVSWALNKMGVNTGMLLEGTIAMTIVAGGIMASSWLLGLGSYKNYPSVDWAEGMGLSLLATMPVVMGYGLLAATGIGALVIGAGILSMLAVAGGIVGVSEILSGGSYTGGPTKEWAEGVGLSLYAFTSAISSLTPSVFGFLMGDSLDSNIESIVKIGDAIKRVSFVIKGGSYNGGPTKEWSLGIGTALALFTTALDKISPNFMERWIGGDTTAKNIEAMVTLASALPRIGMAVGKDSSMYSSGPSKEWAEGVGLSLVHFGSALDTVAPGFFAKLFGASLKENIIGMIQIASALPRIGMAVGKDTSIYSGGPSKDWAEGVGLSLVHFANAFNELKPGAFSTSTMKENIVGMIQMAASLPIIGNILKGADFSTYPSQDWVDGVAGFFDRFSKLTFTDNADDTARNITKLSMSYLTLAKSMSVLGNAMNSIKTAPDLTGLYGGLVTLSLVDSEKLDDTLDVLYNKQDQFQKVLSMIQTQSEVKIDNSTFAFNKDNTTASNSNTKESKITGQSSDVTPIIVNNKETTSTQQITKTDELLNKLVMLMSGVNNVLEEIADNTGKNLSSNSNVIMN